MMAVFSNDEQITQFLKKNAQSVNEVITNFIPQTDVPPLLKESMEYSLLAGGKRIRPLLTLITYEAFGKNSDKILPIAINLELLHTYSLVHDDLPAMDNDDYRRGKLTNHKVYGESMAILAGDALLTLAFSNMAKQLRQLPEIPADVRLQIIEEFGDYSGACGMVGGQVLDTLGDQKNSSLEDLIYVHTHKTGDLLVFSIRLGALLAGASAEQLNKLTDFGRNIGLAFQIQDDILDVIGDSEKLGKKVGSDQTNHKITYPFFKGIEESKQEVQILVKEAKEMIKDIGIDTTRLFQVADFMVFRDR